MTALLARLRAERVLPSLAVVVCAGLAAGCTGAAAGAAQAPAGRQGTADVAYAGSLANLNEKVIGPAFSRATGHGYQGRGEGSLALSQEIRSGEITPNVFESVGAQPITSLGSTYPGWYIRFAASPIVVAYNPDSRYASALKAIASGRRPISALFALMATPGFRLGRTNPTVDPQGAAFVEMLQLAQSSLRLPGNTVTKICGGPPAAPNSPQIFAETALEPRLQAGQLDAASAYLSQAVQLHLPYISLPASINLGDPALAAHYATAGLTLSSGTKVTGTPLTLNITTIGHTDRAAATAFVRYLLSPAGRTALAKGGYQLLTPTAEGNTAAVPAAIRHELGG